MKKYARLRSSTSFTEQCEPCGGKPPEVPTAVTLDDDSGTTAAPMWQSSNSDSSTCLDGPAVPASTNLDQGEGVSTSTSHSVLAEALKKLSSLRATQHEDDPGLPRSVNSSHWVARSNSMTEVDADSNDPASNSSTFSAGKWPRRAAQFAEAAEQGGIHQSRTSSNAGAAAAAAATALGSMGITRTESCCTHTTHFTHRRSSSMHDIVLSQPAARLSPMATIHTNSHRARAGKGGPILVPPGFPDDDESGWSPPNLLRCSTSYSAAAAATAPPGRRLPTDPLQLSCHLWEEGLDAPPGTGRSAVNAKRDTGVQSMRYDRWPGAGPAGWTMGEGGGAGKLDQLAMWEGRVELQSQSVREGAAQASAVAAMAQAYAEKYGIARAGMDLECMSCGRGRGPGGILESESPSPGSSYDSSFCRLCRPPVLPVQVLASAAAAPSASTNSKKGGGAGGLSRGMMHYCRKLLLRMGKKPSHKYTLV